MHELGRRDYRDLLARMREFTAQRDHRSDDELWLTEHDPVYTLGHAGREQDVHDAGSIALVRSDRGGQVTYHGPGQAVAYLLIDLRRRRLSVHGLVCAIEQAVIDLLRDYAIDAKRRPKAPGVYVAADGAKIASVGLKISHGCSYHGVALNVAMDLEPFLRIDPCGMPGLRVTDMATCVGAARRLGVADVGRELTDSLCRAIAAA